MPKAAVLVLMDMPENCLHCPMGNYVDIDDFVNEETVCGVLEECFENGSKTRDPRCPLRPLPEKCDIEKLAYPENDKDFMRGWNACITELLKLMEKKNEIS